jgi:hypothetical protein
LDDPEAFRAFCRRWREAHPSAQDASFQQWSLEPAVPAAPFFGAVPAIQEAFVAPLCAPWVWHDPMGDCSYKVRDGLVLYAANGRDLWGPNETAPRLLRPVSGGFTVETICLPALAERPMIGGLLLWKDRENFLRLERGTHGPHDLWFLGCLGNKEQILGRGRLPSEQVVLRLERLGSRVNALCSADGHTWFTLGQVEFPREDPVEVGVHAIGDIDRLIYPGAYPEGTAIRFERFSLWQ